MLDFGNLTDEQNIIYCSVVDEIKYRYNDFIDRVCMNNGNGELIWAVPFISRNLFHSNLFRELCRLELVKKSKLNETIIVENEDELKFFKRCFPIKKIQSKTKQAIIKKIINNLLCDAIEIIEKEKLKNDYKDKIKACRKQILDTQLNKEVEYVALIEPLLSNSFYNGCFEERYIKDINSYTDENILVIPELCDNGNVGNKEFVNRIISDKKKLRLCIEGYLKNDDFFMLRKYDKLCKRLKKQKYYFNGIDITQLILYNLENTMSYHTMNSIMCFKAIERMRDVGIKIKTFVIWYEGRPFDIMISSAIRNFYPKAKCIGYEGFPTDKNWFSLSPTKYQYVSGHAPKTMAIGGHCFMNNVNQFYSNIDVINMPILRNDYNIIVNKRENERKRILLILPYFIDYAKDILHYIDRYFLTNTEEIDILLKNHPVNKDFRLCDYGVEFSHKVSFVEGALDKCLENVDIAVTSVSTSSLEVIFSGVNLILIGQKGKMRITYLPDEVCELFRFVFSQDEFNMAMKHFLYDNPANDYSKLNNMLVRKEYFDMDEVLK